MLSPERFIAQLNDLYPRYPEMSGGCLKFHYILVGLYPQGKGWYNSDHVITEIDGKFYDVGGIVEETKGYLPFEDFGEEHFKSSFSSWL